MRLIQGLLLLFVFSAVLYSEEENEVMGLFDIEAHEETDFCDAEAKVSNPCETPPCVDEEEINLSYIEKSNPNLIHNCVCAISGAYVDSGVDFYLPGPAPLKLERYYNSKMNNGSLAKGWGFTNYDALKVDEYEGYIELGKWSLQKLVYSKHKSHYRIHSLSGYTNLSHGFPSGRNNLKNQIVDARGKNHILITTPNEEERKFLPAHEAKIDGKNLWHEVSRYNLSNNGFDFIEGQTSSKLERIEAKNRTTGEIFNHIIFADESKHTLRAQATETLWVKYFFREKKHGRLLTWIEKNGGYFERYTYENDKIVRKDFPEGRYLEIEYYSGDDKSRCKDKVKALYKPGNCGEKSKKMVRFDYDKNATHIYDALGNKTSVKYDHKGHLSEIRTHRDERNVSGSDIYRSERYIFGHGDDESNLITKILCDSTGKGEEGLAFEYDKQGNIVKKSLYGHLTGKKSPPLVTYDKHIKENGCECETVKYTYNSHNRVESETHDNGLKIKYQYSHSRPDLLKGKLIYENDVIRKREFFHYDKYGNLVTKIVDNAIAKDEKDFSYINERHITKYILWDTAPVGFPRRTEEYAVDLINHQEILLRWKEEEFSREGKLLSSKIYGADGTLYESRSYTYDLLGHLISEIEPTGREIRREYDKNGNVLKEITPEYTIENTYDFSNQLILQVKTIPGGMSLSTSYVYNDLGKKIKMIDSYGHETKYEYDFAGRLKEITFPEVMTENGEWVCPQEKMHYDIADRPDRITDRQGGETKTKFNVRGDPTRITYPDGVDESFIYDLKGRLVEKKEKNGTRKRIERDYLGRPTKESIVDEHGNELSSIQKSYNAFHLISSKDSEGRETLYTYDWAGRVASIQNGSALTQYSYDGLGRLIHMREKVDENIWRYTTKKYDALSRQIEERIESSSGELLHLDRFEYDGLGNKIYEQTGSNIRRTTYNGFNLPIEIIDSYGNTTHITYDFNYINSHGQRVLKKETTDPKGTRTEEIYDTLGRCVETCRKSPMGECVSRKQCVYNLLGALCEVRNECFIPGESEKTKITRCYEYNEGGLLVVETLSYMTNEDRTTVYEYNSKRQKIKKTKPDGVEINYEYDSKGRVEHIYSSDHTVDYRTQYNSDDKVIESRDLIQGKTTTLTYDREGRVIHEKLANDLEVHYDYDCGGRTRKVTLPDASAIEYVYDCLNLKEIHRLKENTRVYSHTEQEHSLLGQPTRLHLSNHQEMSISYDALGRKISLQSPTFSQQVPEGGFDPAGNLVSLITQGERLSFSYDGNYQISEEKDHRYICDSLGNRRIKNGEMYQVNSLNQLISKGSTTYTYDRSGNLILKNEGGRETRYHYDALDRLTEIISPEGTTTYRYDVFNRRVSQKLPTGQEQQFLIVGEEEVGLSEGGVLQELKVLGKGKRHPAVAMEIKGKVFIPIQDLLGNTVQLCSMDGSIVQSFKVSSFGEMSITQGETTPLAPWIFSGKRQDSSGLIYFGLRYYDPSIGRWISADPSGFGDGENLYAYVRNNPLIYFDEKGLDSLLDGMWDSVCTVANATYDFFCLAGASLFDFSPPETYCTNDLINPETGEHYNFPDPPVGVQVYHNGILNNKSNFDDSLVNISQITGYNTEGVFSHSRGFFGDAVSYLAELLGYRSQGSFALQDTLETMAAEKPVILIAHSEGCASARNALMHMEESLCDNIYYLAVCPGAYTEQTYCNQVTHLCSSADIVPYFDFIGRSRCFESIIEIQRHEDAFFFDHSVTSPTFRDHIADTVKNYYSQLK